MSASVVLLSGGLDSTVAFQVTLAAGGPVLALTACYGQRAEARELAAARAMAAARGVEHRTVDLRWLGRITETALCSDAAELPRPAASDLDGPASFDSAAAVWVPNRNGVLLNVAAAFAESLRHTDPQQTAQVVVGFNREEAATFPDNTPEFLGCVEEAFRYSTRGPVRAVSPTSGLDKEAIVRLGREVGAPLEHVWVCYEASDEHCGTCESCRRFERALERAEATAWWRAARESARAAV